MRLIEKALLIKVARRDVESRAKQDLEDVDRRLRSALMAFFARRVNNRSDAEDLTQEVFVRLAQSENNQVRCPDAYVFQIAANLLRDTWRREKVRAEYREAEKHEDYSQIDFLDPFRNAVGRQDMEFLARMIAELPEKTRRIFILYRIENIDKRVIADSFGLSTRMVEIHIQKALLVLFDRLEIER